MYKKVFVSTIVSAIIISVLIVPSFAAPDSSVLDKKIGNELVANFNIQSSDVEDTVILSWDAAALDIEQADYDGDQNESINVDYYVSPGVDNDDDITVSVYLKLHNDQVSVLEQLSVGVGEDQVIISSAFTEEDYTYYLLQEGIKVLSGEGSSAFDFDISFNEASGESTPFTASLIAIQEEVVKPSAPTLKHGGTNYHDGNYNFITYTYSGDYKDYFDNITSISVSYDNVEFNIMDISNEFLRSEGVIAFLIVSLNVAESTDLYFKIESDGYEDLLIKYSEE